MKTWPAPILVAALYALTLPPCARTGRADAQESKGQSVNSYREGRGGGRPAWVEEALRRSIAHLKQRGRAFDLVDPEAELTLAGADRDELGQTHVRLDQVFRGVPVFGGQLITHMDAGSVRDFVSGRVFGSARRVDTRPRIDAARAVEAAKAALGYAGRFAREPQAKLVVLPHELKTRHGEAGATLVYLVELLIMDGTPDTAHHYYFVNAADGSVVWHYNNLRR